MNACTDRNAEEVSANLTEHAEGLKGMAHDEVRLGIGLGLLMQILHRRHLAALLGLFDAVENQDGATTDLVDREVLDHDGEPKFCKPVRLHGIAVEEME